MPATLTEIIEEHELEFGRIRNQVIASNAEIYANPEEIENIWLREQQEKQEESVIEDSFPYKEFYQSSLVPRIEVLAQTPEEFERLSSLALQSLAQFTSDDKTKVVSKLGIVDLFFDQFFDFLYQENERLVVEVANFQNKMIHQAYKGNLEDCMGSYSLQYHIQNFKDNGHINQLPDAFELASKLSTTFDLRGYFFSYLRNLDLFTDGVFVQKYAVELNEKLDCFRGYEEIDTLLNGLQESIQNITQNKEIFSKYYKSVISYMMIRLAKRSAHLREYGYGYQISPFEGDHEIGLLKDIVRHSDSWGESTPEILKRIIALEEKGINSKPYRRSIQNISKEKLDLIDSYILTLISKSKDVAERYMSNISTLCPLNCAQLERIHAQGLKINIKEGPKFDILFTEGASLEVILSELGFNPEERDSQIQEFVNSHQYSPTTASNLKHLAEILIQKNTFPNNLSSFFLEILRDEDYIDQNIWALANLVENDVLKGESDTQPLTKLMQFTKGLLSIDLTRRLCNSTTLDTTINDWENERDHIQEGNFDLDNPLHIDLGFIEFLRKSILNQDYYFNGLREEYLDLVSHHKSMSKGVNFSNLSSQEVAEVYALAYESAILANYIKRIHKLTQENNSSLWIIPNMRYGIMPLIPIMPDLEEMNIPILRDIKVGSTECHKDPHYIVRDLFGSYSFDIMNKKPTVLILDGTEHLISREGEGKQARYPDAHQGYLNEMILINLARGFKTKGQTQREEHLKRHQIQTIEQYKALLPPDYDTEDSSNQAFSFHFWNTASADLIIRSKRKSKGTIKPYTPRKIKNPQFIFCNVGVEHHQLPKHIQEMFGSKTHKPAFYDDMAFYLAKRPNISNRGIVSTYPLEEQLRRVYQEIKYLAVPLALI